MPEVFVIVANLHTPFPRVANPAGKFTGPKPMMGMRTVLEAWSLGRPDDSVIELFMDTAIHYFGEGGQLTFGQQLVMACRGCGCTDDRACEGGCEWVDDVHGIPPAPSDLCSRCAKAELPAP
jgi:hypothetical protein